ncbi:hypothetical protein [Catellatospora chokoriensis]|uniref:Uncharacterized protein n=1 Tax=Catellatospora chokoriensis TaxID=310353 RepID=A0A8J3NQJ7_9ACTN|nr:hypothetical protein [Catellatospora chokoriensis]GIF88571.1 hypothetical protein Cch02nite_20150 [Catellatospora chokoriensis]
MAATPSRARGRHAKPVVLPDELALLTGPTSGIVSLPRHLKWSGTARELARRADPGFDVHVFATALRSLERITDTDFAEYQVTPERLAALRKDFGDWAHALQKSAA